MKVKYFTALESCALDHSATLPVHELLFKTCRDVVN